MLMNKWNDLSFYKRKALDYILSRVKEPLYSTTCSKKQYYKCVPSKSMIRKAAMEIMENMVCSFQMTCSRYLDMDQLGRGGWTISTILLTGLLFLFPKKILTRRFSSTIDWNLELWKRNTVCLWRLLNV